MLTDKFWWLRRRRPTEDGSNYSFQIYEYFAQRRTNVPALHGRSAARVTTYWSQVPTMRFTRNVLQLFFIDMKNTAVKRNLENCVCHVMNVGFLRFRVCSQGIKPLEKKLQLFVTSCDNRQPCMKFHSSSVVCFQSVRRGKAGTSEGDTVEPSTDGAALSLVVDASDFAADGLDGRWSTLAFFSQISVPLKQYRAFRRELLAFYLSLHHFQHWPEG
ncbi:hypothetical protein T11_2330 [Trichinella zimbabwensis]|uniref:Uncharacterized protein n=1 Tax=Trichinella zimbabwensis TaxID=268475 RepID=A0A0V1HRW9_9BILA|nr:hypothetical protein T11_2330 [Trichinella zimbabwensis]